VILSLSLMACTSGVVGGAQQAYEESWIPPTGPVPPPRAPDHDYFGPCPGKAGVYVQTWKGTNPKGRSWPITIKQFGLWRDESGNVTRDAPKVTLLTTLYGGAIAPVRERVWVEGVEMPVRDFGKRYPHPCDLSPGTVPGGK
jgi:hypothetical protein